MPGISTEIAEDIRFHHPSLSDTYPTIEDLLPKMKANEKLFFSMRPAVGRFTAAALVERRAILFQEIAARFQDLKTEALAKKRVVLATLLAAMQAGSRPIGSSNRD